MIITTTSTIEGHHISEYLGIVYAHNVTSSIWSGWAAGFDAICKLLEQNAAKLGADAVIGVSITQDSSTFYAIGTAVKLSD